MKELNEGDLLYLFNKRAFGNALDKFVSVHQRIVCMFLLVFQSTQELQSDLLFMIAISCRIICLISSTFSDSSKSLQFK